MITGLRMFLEMLAVWVVIVLSIVLACSTYLFLRSLGQLVEAFAKRLWDTRKEKPEDSKRLTQRQESGVALDTLVAALVEHYEDLLTLALSGKQAGERAEAQGRTELLYHCLGEAETYSRCAGYLRQILVKHYGEAWRGLLDNPQGSIRGGSDR